MILQKPLASAHPDSYLEFGMRDIKPAHPNQAQNHIYETPAQPVASSRQHISTIRIHPQSTVGNFITTTSPEKNVQG
jgi:hypothetical protein